MSVAAQLRCRAAGRLLLLRLVDPAGAYFERNSPGVGGPPARGGALYGPGGARSASEAELRALRERSAALRNDRRARAHEVRRRYGALVEAGARALAETGHAVVSAPSGRLDARVVRFWRGDSILDIRCRSATGGIGRSATRLDRHRVEDVDLLCAYLIHAVAGLDPD